MPNKETVSSTATDLIAHVAYSWREVIHFRKLCATLSVEELLEQSRFGCSHRRLEEIAYHVANMEGMDVLRALLNRVIARQHWWEQRDVSHLAQTYCEIVSQWQKKQ